MASIAPMAGPNSVQSRGFALTSRTELTNPANPDGARQVGLPKIGDADLAKLRAQAPRVEAATAIQRLAAEQGLPGFTGIRLRDDKLELYWHGKMPAEVAVAVDRFSTDFEIVVRAAPYTEAELGEEAHRISLQPGVNGAGFLSDLSGLWVGVDDTSTSAEFLAQLNSRVKVVPRTKQPTVPLWRCGDIEPFWGGGVVGHRSGSWPSYRYSYCTAGFGARRNSDNVEVLTLSDHCGNPNDEWHTPEGERTVGWASGEMPGIDGSYLHGKDYAPRVYVGPNNGASGVAINGWVYPVEGMLVCYSGGFSGANCSSYVRDVGVWEDGIGPGFWTEDPNHVAAAGQGDSGGPVLAASTGSGLNGVGIITLGDLNTQTTCQGLGDRTCSWRVFNTNLGTALAVQGLSLQTES